MKRAWSLDDVAERALQVRVFGSGDAGRLDGAGLLVPKRVKASAGQRQAKRIRTTRATSQ